MAVQKLCQVLPLVVPITSVFNERVFSVRTAIKRTLRNRLSFEIEPVWGPCGAPRLGTGAPLTVSLAFDYKQCIDDWMAASHRHISHNTADCVGALTLAAVAALQRYTAARCELGRQPALRAPADPRPACGWLKISMYL